MLYKQINVYYRISNRERVETRELSGVSFHAISIDRDVKRRLMTSSTGWGERVPSAATSELQDVVYAARMTQVGLPFSAYGVLEEKGSYRLNFA